MSVHAYTALGVVLALLMVHLSYAGEVEIVLWLFLAAMIIDYITYAFAPMVLLWSADYLPEGWLGGVVASMSLLASCYQFCRSDAKTDDHFFVGFPSYWNIAAFYLIALGASTAATTTTLWLGLYALVLMQCPSPSLWLIALSGGYVLYYAALSLYLTLNRRSQDGDAAGSDSAADSSSAVGDCAPKREEVMAAA